MYLINFAIIYYTGGEIFGTGDIEFLKRTERRTE